MAETFRYKRIRLESVSESSSEISDTESVYSLQGKETECVRDTSDTEIFEYEVTEIADSQNVLLSSTDESELEDIAELGAAVATLAYEDSNFDIAIQADTSEENSTSPTSNSDADPELPRSDYLDFQQCLICKTEDKNTSYPYCAKCFLWKKSFFPPRPEKKKSKKKINLYKQQNLKHKSISDCLSYEGLDNCNDAVSKLGSQESSFDEGSCNSSDDKTLCKTCFARQMNGVFIHGTTGHMHSCYYCAKKTWKNIGVCPICRKKCHKVIKLYTSFERL